MFFFVLFNLFGMTLPTFLGMTDTANKIGRETLEIHPV
jgi:hypothetical protein